VFRQRFNQEEANDGEESESVSSLEFSSVCALGARKRKEKTMYLAKAKLMIEANGSFEMGRGICILSSAPPKTSNPRGTDAAPMKFAVSSTMAKGGSPSGAVG
jgi:hypothetical protein